RGAAARGGGRPRARARPLGARAGVPAPGGAARAATRPGRALAVDGPAARGPLPRALAAAAAPAGDVRRARPGTDRQRGRGPAHAAAPGPALLGRRGAPGR